MTEEKRALPQPDVLAWPLLAAKVKLKECGCIYTVEETIAPRQDGQNFIWYVAKQTLTSNDMIHHLTVCRKLGKEVL